MADVNHKFKLGGVEYDSNLLSQVGVSQLEGYRFCTDKIIEIRDHLALLQRAKNSYMVSLKSEILATKAGILLDDN